MKEIFFKTEDWGILTTDICWTNLTCPYCKNYHSNNFLFKLKKDRNEYIGKCVMCGNELKIKIPKETNNELISFFERNQRRLTANGNKPLEEFL